MGQNTRIVEQSVINLENQQIISLEQAQSFIQDYQNQTQKIKDVLKFVDSPNLQLFLKYYIQNKYPSEKDSPLISEPQVYRIQEDDSQTARNQTHKQVVSYTSNVHVRDTYDRNMCEERAKIQQELVEYIVKQIQQQIVGQYKKMQYLIQETYKQLYQVLVNHKTYQIKNILMQKMIKALQMSEIVLVQYDYYSQTIQKYDQQLGFYQSIRSQMPQFDFLYKKYFQNTLKEGITIQKQPLNVIDDEELKPKILIRCTKGKKDCLVEFVDQKRSLINILCENNRMTEQLTEEVEIVIRALMDEYFQESYLKNEQQKLRLFFTLMLQILQLSLEMRQKVLRISCRKLFSLQHIQEDQSIEAILENFIKKQNIQLRPQQKSISLDIYKHSNRIKREFSNIKLYRHKIEDQKISYFMDFDRYGELRFCYGELDENLMIKINNFNSKGKIKLIDIMTEYHSVIHHFRQAIKGNFKPGVRQEQFDQIKCKTYINQNQILDRLHVQIKKTRKNQKSSKTESHWVYFESEQEFEVEQVTQKQVHVQQQLIKDLEKQEPGIKNDGWLNLFIKSSGARSYQNPTNILRKKISERTVVTVYQQQQLSEIQQYSFDTLNCNNKKIQAIIWKLLSICPFFSEIVTKGNSLKYYQSFVSTTKKLYTQLSNTYHNFNHAINVMHMAYNLLKIQASQQFLSDIDVLAILLAGLGHDIGHPGTSNQFQIDTLSKYALNYNDNQPLQKASSYKFLTCLKQNNFLIEIQPETARLIKESIVQNILNTDQGMQGRILMNFKNYRNMSLAKKKENTNFLTAIIIQSAQHCSYVKQEKISLNWSIKYFEEFDKIKTQKNSTKGQDLQGQFMHRKRSDLTKWLDNEQKFAYNIVLPLYYELSQFYDDAPVFKALLKRFQKSKKEQNSLRNQGIILQDIQQL